MPSPIAPAAAGYLVYRAFRSRIPEEACAYVGPFPRLMIAAVSLSLIADLDTVPGILSGNFERFHNNFTNSLVFGVAVALGVGGAVWMKQRSGFKRWFAIALVSYEMHVLMDFFTFGRGVMLAWPFSPDRLSPPVYLFYGLRWSEGLASPMHLVTLMTELGFVGFLSFFTYVFSRLRSPRSHGRAKNLMP